VEAHFDRHADEYEAAVERSIAFSGLPHAYFTEAKARRLLEIVRRRLGDPASLSAVDVGCGPGLTDALLAPKLRSLHGVDISGAMLERAARENPSVCYRAFDGSRLPFDDAAFDLAFAVNVLHHVPPAARGALLAEMWRVARPGGLVAVFEHNPLNPLTRRVVRTCSLDEGVELLGRRALARLFRACGLRVAETSFLLFFPWKSPAFRAIERRLAPVPFGAQYVVVGERPD
jgi:SAM-dependent methyltransferase